MLIFVRSIHAMRNFMTIILLALLLFCIGSQTPQDGFGGIRCGSDIPKTLIGRHMSNNKVVEIENRHKDLYERYTKIWIGWERAHPCALISATAKRAGMRALPASNSFFYKFRSTSWCTGDI